MKRPSALYPAVMNPGINGRSISAISVRSSSAPGPPGKGASFVTHLRYRTAFNRRSFRNQYS
jgi:hypothetical protein